MSVTISFRKNAPPDADWWCSRWTFDQLAEDVMRSFPNDTALVSVMRGAKAVDGLLLYLNDRELAVRIVKAIRQVALDTIEGRILVFPETTQDPQDYRTVYLTSLSDLVTKIDVELPELEKI